MAQDGTTAGGASYTLDNVTFPVGRNKLQSIFDAIRSTNIGNTAPDLVAGQFWIDNNTPSTTVWTLYLYDGTDSIQFATIDTINNTVNFIDSAFDLIVDTTPQLGGNLDLNSNDITGTGNINITGNITASGNLAGTLTTASQPNITSVGTLTGLTTTGDINFGDNDKANFGASNDLKIYHTGNDSIIEDVGTGELEIRSNGTGVFLQKDTTEYLARFLTDGASELYYDNSKKLETTSSGVTVTGTVTADGVSLGDNDALKFGTGNDLQIYHTGVDSYINDSGTGNLKITSNGAGVDIQKTTTEYLARFITDGAVELYYDNVKKIETTSSGIDVTGTITSTGNITTSGTIESIAPERHSIRPSLNLDFANSKTLDPRITFTRASSGVYYDGYSSVKAEENLVSYSQDYSQGVWSKFNLTVTDDDTTAPDGTTTGASLITNTVNTNHYIAYNYGNLANVEVTQSWFAKANGYNHCFIGHGISTTEGAWFNLSTGTTGTVGATLTSSSITDVGNGWYRCSITYTVSNTVRFAIIAPCSSDGVTSFTGDGSSGIYAWGGQVEQRDAVTAYTPTTSSPITKYQPQLQTAGSNIARFDHNPTTGESLGLLIEEQRTNLATNSESFGGGNWDIVRATKQSDVVIAPDGTLTGDKLIASGSSDSYLRYNNVTASSGTTYTSSVYAKAGEYNFLFLHQTFISGGTAYFDLVNGLVTSTGANATASITDVGNGWYRCSITFTADNSTAIYPIIITVAEADGDEVTSADPYKGIYVWGGQVEVGSFPTSYIKTTGSQVTRSNEEAVMNNIDTSEWFKQGQGTLYAEVSHIDPDITGTNLHFLNLENTSSEDFLGMRFIGDEKIQFLNVNNGAYSVIINSSNSSTLANTYHKASFSFTKDDAKTSLNGTTIGTDTSFNISEFDRLNLSHEVISSTQRQNGHMKKASYYPINLTQNEINDLTEA